MNENRIFKRDACKVITRETRAKAGGDYLLIQKNIAFEKLY
jgi:hypothetical protein